MSWMATKYQSRKRMNNNMRNPEKYISLEHYFLSFSVPEPFCPVRYYPSSQYQHVPSHKSYRPDLTPMFSVPWLIPFSKTLTKNRKLRNRQCNSDADVYFPGQSVRNVVEIGDKEMEQLGTPKQQSLELPSRSCIHFRNKNENKKKSNGTMHNRRTISKKAKKTRQK